MQLSQLVTTLKTYERTSYIYEGLTLSETKSVRLWENAGILLKEAALTPDQIQQIFKSVEQGATDAGSNRTMLGKGKDAAAAVNKAWEDLKTKVQDSGPIQAVDQAYDSAVAKIEAGLGGPDNAVNQIIQKYRTFAKEHPVAQGFIYSALIAAAGISGAGLGGAAVLGLLKMADKLLQGEKFSSAAYSGAKTGAMAYGASKIGDLIKGKPEGEVPASSATPDAASGVATPPSNANTFADLAKDPNLNPIQQKFAADLAAGKNIQGADEYIRKSIEGAAKRAEILGQTADGSANAAQAQFMSLQRLQNAMLDSQGAAGQAASNAASSAVSNVSGTLSGVSQEQIFNSPIYKQVYAQQIAKFGSTAQGQLDAAKVARAAAKAAILKGQTNESVSLSENQIEEIFAGVVTRQLDEGILDTIKGAAGKAANWAQTKGHNLTTKVTADKLNSAWKAAGSPTDSEEVSKVIQGAGVPAETISKVYTDLQIPAPAAPADAEKTEPTMDPNAPTAPADPNAKQEPAMDPASQPATPADAAQPATPGAEPPASSQAEKQSKVGVGQINKIIPTLRVRDLKSVQKTVDTTIAKRQTTKQPTAEGKYVGFYSKFLDKEI